MREVTKLTTEDVISIVKNPYLTGALNEFIVKGHPEGHPYPTLLFWGDEASEPVVAGLYSRLFAMNYDVTHMPLRHTLSVVKYNLRELKGKKIIGVQGMLEEGDAEKYRTLAQRIKGHGSLGLMIVSLFPQPRALEFNGSVVPYQIETQ